MSRVQVLLPLPEVNRIAKRFAVLLFSIDRGSHIPECSQSYKIEWLTCAWLPLFFIPLWEMAVLFTDLWVIEYLHVLHRLIVHNEQSSGENQSAE